MASTGKGTKHSTFITKLWDIVNDPSKNDVISWVEGGESFVINNNNPNMWNKLLPIYFKHNNMSSFIRQLNMYGFHKIAPESSTVECERTQSRFYHPYFQKGQPELLNKIVRNQTTSTTRIPKKEPQFEKPESQIDNNIKKVLTDVSKLRNRQGSIDQQLASIKSENAALWRELSILRSRHIKQSQIVNKLIQFLLTLVQPNTRMGGIVKRKMPLMLSDSPKKRKSESEPLTIQELNPDTYTNDTHDPDVQINVLSPNTDPGDSLIPDEIPSDEQLIQLNLLAEDPEETKSTEDANMVDELLNINTEGNENEILNEFNLDQQLDLATNSADNDLNNLITGKYNTTALSTAKGKNVKEESETENSNNKDDQNLAVTPFQQSELQRLNSVQDLDDHISIIQTELDTIKDLLSSANSVNASHLLGLFNGEFQIPNPDPFGNSDVSQYNEYVLPDFNIPGNGQSDTLTSSDPVLSNSLLNYTNPKPADLQNIFEEEEKSPLPEANLKYDNFNESSYLETPQIENENNEFFTPQF